MGIIGERLNPNKKQVVELEFLLSQLFFYVLFWSFVGHKNISGSIRFCTDLNRRTVCNRCPLTLTQGCSEVKWLLKVKKFDDNQNAGGALCYFWNANALLFILNWSSVFHPHGDTVAQHTRFTAEYCLWISLCWLIWYSVCLKASLPSEPWTNITCGEHFDLLWPEFASIIRGRIQSNFPQRWNSPAAVTVMPWYWNTVDVVFIHSL